MPKKLEDKGAVIAGGTEEIGLATATLVFVKQGGQWKIVSAHFS